MLGASKSIWGFDPRSIPGCTLWLDGADNATMDSTSAVTVWNDKSGQSNTMTGTGTWSGGTMVFNGTTNAFSNTAYVFPFGAYSMFAVYSNTTAPASTAYMNAVYGSNGFPMLGVYDVNKYVTARSVVANTGPLIGIDPSVAWGTRISGSGHDLAYGVATDLSNNILVSGRYGTLTSTAFGASGGSLSLPQQNIDNAYLIKYSSAGTPLWVSTIYTTTFSHGFAVATDPSGNVFMTGNYASAATFYNPDRSSTVTLPFSSGTDIFVAKYSSVGTVLWAAQIAGGADHGYGIAADSSGNVLVTGITNTPTFYDSSRVSNASLASAGGDDAFVAKYSSTGSVVWVARIGSVGGSDVGYAVTTDTSDNVFVTGSYGGAMTLCNAGGTTTIVTFPSSTGCFVIKYSSAGVIQWASRIVGGATTVAGQGGAFGIGVDTSGNVFVTGPYTAAATFYNASGTSGATFTAPSGGTDTFVAKYSSAGAVLWVAQITSTGSDISYGLSVDPSGNVFVNGTYDNALTLYNTGGTVGATLPTGPFYFIAKYSSAGVVLWAARIAGYPNTALFIPPKGGCAADRAGNVTVVGCYATSATLYNSAGASGTTLANGGSNDTFIAKYHSSGNFGATFSMSSNVLTSATYTPSTLSSFINGTKQTTLSGTTPATTGIYVGGPSNYFNGSISEVLIYGTTLTNTQRQSVEGYLSMKWGIGSGLVSTHPFYTISPFSRYFNPNDVPGCSLWLDAADPTSVGVPALYTADAGIVTTLAGSGTATFADGTGSNASFNLPMGVAVLPNSNIVVADQTNNRIRLVTYPGGVVTTLAGSGTATFADGTGSNASFRNPRGVAVLPNSNVVVADYDNNRIRIVTQAGVVTTLAGSNASYADGTGSNASFSAPWGVAVFPNSNIVVSDLLNSRIRLVTYPGGVVTTLAGTGTFTFADGTGSSAGFSQPRGVAVLPDSNIVLADMGNNRIRVITLAGVVTTLAGQATPGSADGTGSNASFNQPTGIAVISSGLIAVTDAGGNRTRLVTYPGGVVTTLAGGTAAFADGMGSAASFKAPSGVAVLPNGTLVVTEQNNYRIRLISGGGVQWNDKSGLNNTMIGTATWTGSNMSFNGSTQFSNTTYVFPASNYSMFGVYSNTTAPASTAYMNAVYGNGGFPMLGVYDVNKYVTARSVVANTGEMKLTSQVGWALQMGSTGTDSATALTIDSSGNIVVGGFFGFGGPLSIYNQDGSTGATLSGPASYSAFIATFTPAGKFVSALQITSTTGTVYVAGLNKDSSGNIYVCGDYAGAATLYNKDGSVGGTLAVGGYSSWTYFAKYSAAGTLVWAARGASVNSVSALCIAPDPSGNVFVGGTAGNQTSYFNADTTNANANNLSSGGGFLLKYSSTGVYLWGAAIGGRISSVVSDSSGSAVIAGIGNSFTQIFLNSDGTTAKSYATSGGSNTYIAKYLGATGFLTWAGRIGGTTSSGGYGVAVDSGNNVLVTGTAINPNPISFYNSDDTVGATLTSLATSAFIAKYSSAGFVAWAAQGTHSGGGSNRGYAITTDSNANVIITGNTSSTIMTFSNANGTSSGVVLSNKGSNDCFVAKYTSAGVVSWATQIAGTGDDYGYGIVTDSNGNVYVCGSYTSAPLTFYNTGGTTATTLATTLGASDGFLAKYSSNGYIVNLLSPPAASSNVLVSATYTPSTFSPFVNGSTATTLPGTTVATTGIYVGGPSNYFNGTISELLIYASTLTAAQRQQVEGYLIQKWGLSAQTLSNHPYKLIPPATSQPAQFSEVTPGNWTRDWRPQLLSLAAANASGVTLTGSHITGGATYLANGWFGGVLGSDGNIYFAPYAALNILKLTVATGVTTNITGGATYTSNGWRGGVLGPDGNIYFTPFAATNILKLTVATGVTSNITGGATYTANGWIGGALGPDGNIYFMPFAATNILKLTVATGVTSNITGGATYTASGWAGTILGPDGHIYGTPYNATNILRLNVSTGVTTNITGGATYTSGGWQGQTLGQDGNIYFAPTTATNVLKFNVATGVTTNVTGGATLSANNTRQNVLGPDGNIYFTPHVGSFILQLNVSTGVITSLTPSGITYNGSGGWQGSILGPDGNIYFAPWAASNILKLTFSGLSQLPSSNYCLSSYANKY